MNATFKQTAKVGAAGSFINQMMGNNSTLPQVGKGATELMYSDRYALEVIEVSEDYKTVTLEELDAVADLSKPCPTGHQNWIYNPTGRFKKIAWKFGSWKHVVETVVLLPGVTDENLFDGETGQFKLIPGKTRIKTTYHKISLLFGRREYYYDWTR